MDVWDRLYAAEYDLRYLQGQYDSGFGYRTDEQLIKIADARQVVIEARHRVQGH